MRIEKDRLICAINTENTALEGSKSSCEQQIVTLENTLDDSNLKSEAYRAIRERIATLRIPLAKAQHNVFEALQNDNTQNLTALSALPETSPGIADTDEAQQRIDELQSINNRYHQQIADVAASGFDVEKPLQAIGQ